jgi:hypothetical protein
LPSNGVRFSPEGKLGHEIKLEIDEQIEKFDKARVERAKLILLNLPEEAQDLFFMTEDEVSTSDLAENLSIPETIVTFIRQNCTPLELVKYEGENESQNLFS